MSTEPVNKNPLQIKIAGKCESVTTHQGTFYHRVKTPAPDPYSSPNEFSVRSKNQICSEGQIFDRLCQISGVIYDKKYKDDAGVNRVFAQANVFLDVI